MPIPKEYHHEVSREQFKSESLNENELARAGAETRRGTSAAVNSEPRSEACDATAAIRNVATEKRYDEETTATTPAGGTRIYENLFYYPEQQPPVIEPTDLELDLSKSLILNKFFRSAERNYAAYENLCSGCGYGVFEARGRLCNFCQYIVHGGGYSSGEGDTNGNIYENICEKCASIFSSDECEFCQIVEISAKNTSSNTLKSESTDFSCDESVYKKNVKSKRDKKSNFLRGIIGSLRRIHLKPNSEPSHTPLPPSLLPAATRQRLKIIHNVEGFDNVFRTQESFDLGKICELKRTQTSNSDQHIYGRLKQRPCQAPASATLPATLSQSHDQLRSSQSQQIELSPKQVASADCLNSSLGTGTETVFHKKNFRKLPLPLPLIRKFRPLDPRAQHKHKQVPQTVSSQAKQSLYLDENVCQWLTSLRRDIHYYESIAPADDLIGCDAKSVPAKRSLAYGQIAFGGTKELPSLRVTDIDDPRAVEILYADLQDINYDFSTFNEHEASRSSSPSSPLSSREPETIAARSLERQMVDDFMRNVMSKQSQQQNQADRTETVATAERSTATAAITRALPTSAQDRAKRKAIYLKPDDTTPYNGITVNAYNPCNDFTQRDANFNYSSQQQQQQQHSQQLDVKAAALPLASRRGLTSHRVALQSIAPSTLSQKRCGHNERNSEFVNDILFAFEHFLRRETDDGGGIPSRAEVAGKHVPGGDLPPLVALEQSQLSVAHNSEVLSGTSSHPASDRKGSPTELGDTSLVIPLVEQSLVNVSKPQSGRREHLAATVNVCALISDLLLSRSLNCVVVYYDKPLSAFLRCLRHGERYRENYSQSTSTHLVRKYERFVSYCQRSSLIPRDRDHAAAAPGISKKIEPDSESVRQSRLGKSVSATGISASSIESKVEGCARSEVEPKSVVSDVLPQEEEEEEDEENIPKNNCKDSQGTNFYCLLKEQDDPKESQQNLQNECSFEELYKERLKVTKEQVSESKVDEVCPSVELSGDLLSVVDTLKYPNSAVKVSQIKPKVPVRNPKTRILHKAAYQPPRPAKRPSRIGEVVPAIMRAPTSNSESKDNANTKQESFAHIEISNDATEEEEEEEEGEVEGAGEESIYQPIWKFKTVGEVQERYHTDADYYEFEERSDHLAKSSPKAVRDSSPGTPNRILISTDIEDHGEWETDDEFMFATQRQLQLEESESGSGCGMESYSLRSSTVRSTCSGSSLTGSTVTGFASSSSITMSASAVSTSLMHHLFRSVGIFYSLTEPKLRAIIYDYDRVYATTYFAGQAVDQLSISSGGGTKDKSEWGGSPARERSPLPPPRTSSASKSKVGTSAIATTNRSFLVRESVTVASQHVKSPAKRHLLPDSVQAWKFMLLDVNYLEDEEDMIVCESEILRAQQPKGDDLDARHHQQHSVQRFKSASIGNLIDIPTEEDKKSIAERMRNKLQRGVFKLNVRSPKSEKKIRSIFRRAEATSLYLEEGMRPKYPIFGAALDLLELNQSTQPNVPRFVVDCVEYIERKDCIEQDGLYRVSGNKVQVDELKQKLCDSYIYHPKLLICDDIHTLTSLLKQFFRELGAPLIPQETYERLGRNLTDEAGIENLKSAFHEMREPNRSTLKFLIEHLTHVASHSSENRMPASNLAIVWGPCLLSANQIEYDIARMNTLAKVLIESYERIFHDENERLVC